MKHYSEEELIRLLNTDQPSVFSYLYKNYSPALFSIINRMIDDRELAEDILQEAFVLIWHNIRQYDSNKGRFFTWMAAVTRNLTLDVLKSRIYRDRRITFGDELLHSLAVNEGCAHELFDTVGLKNQLTHLRHEQKILIDLAYFYGYTQQQISKGLDLPLGTVKTRIRTALFELRKLLQDDPANTPSLN